MTIDYLLPVSAFDIVDDTLKKGRIARLMLSTLGLWEGRGRKARCFLYIETIPRHRKIFILVHNFSFWSKFS
jgi:hypothetical protein